MRKIGKNCEHSPEDREEQRFFPARFFNRLDDKKNIESFPSIQTQIGHPADVLTRIVAFEGELNFGIDRSFPIQRSLVQSSADFRGNPFRIG